MDLTVKSSLAVQVFSPPAFFSKFEAVDDCFLVWFWPVPDSHWLRTIRLNLTVKSSQGPKLGAKFYHFFFIFWHLERMVALQPEIQYQLQIITSFQSTIAKPSYTASLQCIDGRGPLTTQQCVACSVIPIIQRLNESALQSLIAWKCRCATKQ